MESSKKSASEKDKINQNAEERILLNFGDVSSNVFGTKISISVEFKFTNDTISSFSNVLGTFPI